ncbi:hypothetical protein ABDK75_07520 [Gluconobacter sp. OJA]|uniref:hypothetical protein n=1 Tax=Gluconobacter sp. OJA TaxID=3145197 RepID=UPI0031FA40B0
MAEQMRCKFAMAAYLRFLGYLFCINAMSFAFTVNAKSPDKCPETVVQKSGFASLDADHDGRLSWPEFRIALETIIRCKNGIHAREFKALPEPQQESILLYFFFAMDPHQKGFVSESNWKP